MGNFNGKKENMEEVHLSMENVCCGWLISGSWFDCLLKGGVHHLFSSYKCVGKSNLRIVDSSQLQPSLRNDVSGFGVKSLTHLCSNILMGLGLGNRLLFYTFDYMNGFGRNNYKIMCMFSPFCFFPIFSYTFVSNFFKSFLLHFIFKQR